MEFTLTINPTSSSPVITIINGVTYDSNLKAYKIATGDVTLTFIGSNLTASNVLATLEHMTRKIIGTVSSISDTSVTVTFTNVPVGVYSINLKLDNKYGYLSDVNK